MSKSVQCLRICFLFCCLFVVVVFIDADRLIGLVVKASASRAGGPGFESR